MTTLNNVTLPPFVLQKWRYGFHTIMVWRADGWRIVLPRIVCDPTTAEHDSLTPL